MSKIIVLGTGHAMVTECYNSCVVLENNGRYVLVDTGGGNGILRQLKRAAVDIHDIHDVFITHNHFDHMLGLFWIIRAVAFQIRMGSYEGNLTIYTSNENAKLARDYVLAVYPTMKNIFDSRIFFVDLFHGKKLELIDNSFTVLDLESTLGQHFGFTMDYGDKRLAYTSDVPCHKSLSDQLYGSNWLVHESFCLESQKGLYRPHEIHHSTVKDACLIAADLKVKNLVLFHTEDDNLQNRRELYTAEGSQHFSGNIYVPNDLDVISL
ncbi:MAG: MBL fold metallo-hydrolase [Coriobacteriia bacterium]|nr:MBL fold metallo-hydrolase [Coriobacteriia bacterium]MCL2750107.1 MBL fold metallo-hydrolase [Coriobacteriia bacterium]